MSTAGNEKKISGKAILIIVLFSIFTIFGFGVALLVRNDQGALPHSFDSQRIVQL